MSCETCPVVEFCQQEAAALRRNAAVEVSEAALHEELELRATGLLMIATDSFANGQIDSEHLESVETLVAKVRRALGSGDSQVDFEQRRRFWADEAEATLAVLMDIMGSCREGLAQRQAHDAQELGGLVCASESPEALVLMEKVRAGIGSL